MVIPDTRPKKICPFMGNMIECSENSCPIWLDITEVCSIQDIAMSLDAITKIMRDRVG